MAPVNETISVIVILEYWKDAIPVKTMNESFGLIYFT